MILFTENFNGLGGPTIPYNCSSPSIQELVLGTPKENATELTSLTLKISMISSSTGNTLREIALLIFAQAHLASRLNLPADSERTFLELSFF